MILHPPEPLVKMFASIGIPGWDIWIKILLKKGEEGKKWFTQIQKNGYQRQGFIIAGWSSEAKLLWWRPHSSLSDSTHWERFDNDRTVEEPHLYKHLKTALRRIQIQREYVSHKGPAYTGLAYWQHPEATDKPLQKYLNLLCGNQLPGCPTQ